MKLIGMFDSPFVRRVAVSMNCLQLPFDHANWSVGSDLERIRRFSPLGRVPVLVLDDGEVLIESGVILDVLDEFVGPTRALLPAAGAQRRQALRLIAMAVGAIEKGRDQVYERVMRPAEKRHEPWVVRCRAQMHGALGALETECRERGSGRWLVGDRITQVDITVTCGFTFLAEAIGVRGDDSSELSRYPTLADLATRCEALPEFSTVRAAWFAPTV